MNFLRKEWKAIAIVIWLILITIYLSKINGRLDAIHMQNAKTLSTIDSIEGVALSTDAAIVDINKSIRSVDSKVLTLSKRVRRR